MPGPTGDEVVVEQFLEGEELSVIALTDGYTVVPLPAAQDHKRVNDGDQVGPLVPTSLCMGAWRSRCYTCSWAREQGPNTGGMGAYAPAPLATPALLEKVMSTILKPTVRGLRKDGARPWVGGCPHTRAT